jgi:hypothetical protein
LDVRPSEDSRVGWEELCDGRWARREDGQERTTGPLKLFVVVADQEASDDEEKEA